MYALCSSPICFSLLFSIDSIAIEFNFLFFIHLQFCTLSSSVLFLSTSLIYLVRCLLFLFSEKEISSHGLHISHESLSLPLSYAMFPFLLDLLILLSRKQWAELIKKPSLPRVLYSLLLVHVHTAVVVIYFNISYKKMLLFLPWNVYIWPTRALQLKIRANECNMLCKYRGISVITAHTNVMYTISRGQHKNSR